MNLGWVGGICGSHLFLFVKKYTNMINYIYCSQVVANRERKEMNTLASKIIEVIDNAVPQTDVVCSHSQKVALLKEIRKLCESELQDPDDHYHHNERLKEIERGQ